MTGIISDGGEIILKIPINHVGSPGKNSKMTGEELRWSSSHRDMKKHSDWLCFSDKVYKVNNEKY